MKKLKDKWTKEETPLVPKEELEFLSEILDQIQVKSKYNRYKYKYCNNCEKDVDYQIEEAVDLGSPRTCMVYVCLECDNIIDEFSTY